MIEVVTNELVGNLSFSAIDVHMEKLFLNPSTLSLSLSLSLSYSLLESSWARPDDGAVCLNLSELSQASPCFFVYPFSSSRLGIFLRRLTVHVSRRRVAVYEPRTIGQAGRVLVHAQHCQ